MNSEAKIRSSLAVVSTMVCSAVWSIGLSADSCCRWQDESHVNDPSATPVIRATATTLRLVFILDGIFPTLITPRCSQHENGENKSETYRNFHNSYFILLTFQNPRRRRILRPQLGCLIALLGNSRPRQCTASSLSPLSEAARRVRHASWKTWLCKPARYEFLSPSYLRQVDPAEISWCSSP